jgi:PKD repeat protein
MEKLVTYTKWLLAIGFIWSMTIIQVKAQNIIAAEYFFGADPGVGNATPIPVNIPASTFAANVNVPTVGQTAGLQWLYIRVKESNGLWSITNQHLVYLQPLSPPIVFNVPAYRLSAAEYFFDTDPGVGKGLPLSIVPNDSMSIIRTINTTGLSIGQHILGVRFRDITGQWSIAQSGILNIEAAQVNQLLANFTFNTANAGQVVNFTNTTANITPSTIFKWDFNADGVYDATTQNASHTFANTGFYDVLLMAIDPVTGDTSVRVRQVEIGIMLANTLTILSGTTTFCEGDSLVLRARPGSNYLWNTGVTTRDITIKTSGHYTCAYTDNKGVSRTSNTIIVTVNPKMVTNVITYAATNALANGGAEIHANGGSSNNYTYAWSAGSTTAFQTNIATGAYTVTVSDGICPNISTVNIPQNIVNPLSGIVEAEYFFGNTDPGVGNATAIVIGLGSPINSLAQISTAGLPIGFNKVTVRVKAINGQWSIAETRSFYITDPTQTTPNIQPTAPIVAAEYFFDDIDPGTGNGIPVPPFAKTQTLNTNFNANLTGLLAGYHTISIRVLDSTGLWSIATIEDFYIEVPQLAPPDTADYPLIAGEYFIGADPGVGNATPFYVPIGSSFDIARIVNVSSLAVGTYRISVRTRNLAGVWSIAKSAQFTINNTNCSGLVAAFTYPVTVTAGVPFTMTNTSLGANIAATYAWDTDADGITDLTSKNANKTFNTAGVYDVLMRVTNPNGCYSEVVNQIYVQPIALNTLIVTGNLTFCEGDSVKLKARPGSNFLWNNGETTREITVRESGDYTCSYIDAQGISRISNTRTVTVNPAIHLATTVNPATNGIANGSAFVVASGGSAFIYTYNWSNGSTIPTAKQLSAGTHNVTVSDGICPATATVNITNSVVSTGIMAAEYFYDNIDPGVGNGTPIPVTQGSPITTFGALSTAGLTKGYHKVNIRVLNNFGSWSITNTKTFYVTDPTETTPVVVPQPQLVLGEYFFDANDPGPGNATPLTGLSGTTYNGNFNIPVTGLSSGFHTIGVRAKDNKGLWSFTNFETFFVDLPPLATVPNVLYHLVEAEYFIGNDPGVGNGTPIAIPVDTTIDIWRTIDVSSLLPGSYRISIRVRNVQDRWSFPVSQTFDIIPVACLVPQVDFIASAANAGQIVNFTNISTNVGVGATYAWDINADGSVEYTTQNANHTFATAGIYDVRLTITNTGGCISQIIKQVVIGPILNNQITVNGSLTFCSGDSVQLIAPSGSNYIWSTGATTASIWIYTSGNYQCGYTNTQGNFSQTNIATVTVNPSLVTQMQAYNATNGLANGSAGVTVSGGTGFVYSYNWSNGATTPIVSQLSSGLYSVTITDGLCPVIENATIQNVIIAPLVGIVAAEYFFDNIDPGTGNGTPIPVTQGSPTASFANIATTGLSYGFHRVHIRVLDNLGSWSIAQSATFYLTDPIETTPVINPRPNIVAAEYFFDNIDPGVHNATPLNIAAIAPTLNQNYGIPMVGLTPGTHLLSVRVFDSNGDWSITKTEFFNNCTPAATPVAANNITVCYGGNVTLQANPVGGATGYLWTGPNGFTANANTTLTNVATYQSGTYYIQSESTTGCYSAPDSIVVQIDTIPAQPGNISGSTILCLGQQIGNFTVTLVPGATNYTWNLPAGAVILAGNNSNSIAVDFTNWVGSTALITVTVSNSCGSNQSAPFQVERYNNAVPANITVTGNTTICTDETTVLNANTGSNLTYQWLLNGTIVSTNNSYTVDTGGTYILIVTLLNGCQNSDTIQINEISCGTMDCPVVWINQRELTQSGTTLTKTSGGNSWNAAANSLGVLASGFDGWASMQVIETNTWRAFGLASPNTVLNKNSINYGFLLRDNGIIAITENGIQKGTFGTYLTGDILKVERIGTTINYLRNGSIIYTSATPSATDLIVDMSIRTVGATIHNARANFTCINCGTFAISASSVRHESCNNEDDGAITIASNILGTTYKWLDNVALTTNTRTGLAPGVYTVVGYVGLCTDTLAITINVGTACENRGCPIVWTGITNATMNGNTLTKTSGINTAYDAGMNSTDILASGENGWASMKVLETNTFRIFGLATPNVTANELDIDYGFLLRNNGVILISENGVSVGNFGNYSTGDVFKVERIGTTIYYAINDTTVYTSTVASVTDLIADASIRTIGGTIHNVRTNFSCIDPCAIVWANKSNTTATATTITKTGSGNLWDGGANSTKILTSGENGFAQMQVLETNTFRVFGLATPNVTNNNTDITYGFQLRDNGIVLVVEGGISKGNFGAYNTGDVFRVERFGTAIEYYRNNDLLYTSLTPSATDLIADISIRTTGGTIYNVQTSFSCLEPCPIVWTGTTNATINALTVTKTSGGTAWNAGANSTAVLTSGTNGWVTMQALETNTYRVFGLAAPNATANITDINYGIQLRDNGNVYIVENGISLGIFGAYNTGDIFKVERVGTTITYYRNGVLLYTSLVPSATDLIADISIRNVGGTVYNVQTTFSCVARPTNIATTVNTDNQNNTGNPFSEATAYPNPFGDQLILNYTESVQDVKTIELYHINGQHVRSIEVNANGQTIIDTSDLNSGLYIISINGIKHFKVVKM